MTKYSLMGDNVTGEQLLVVETDTGLTAYSRAVLLRMVRLKAWRDQWPTFSRYLAKFDQMAKA